MKTLTGMISLLAFVSTAAMTAQPARPESFERLRVKSQQMPVFPFDLMQAGVREGQVCVAFSTDVTGKVDDCLAVAYSHPDFARVAVAAVRKWTFEPARLSGQPIATASEVIFNFETQGTVVLSLTAAETLTIWMNRMHQLDESYYPRTLRELDRIPTPIAAPSPSYSAALAERGHIGTISVNFYIDETGAVRLPAVESGNDPELAALAINAIQTWKFEPPTCHGRKVLTKTNQVFRFRPTGAPMAAAAEKN